MHPLGLVVASLATDKVQRLLAENAHLKDQKGRDAAHATARTKSKPAKVIGIPQADFEILDRPGETTDHHHMLTIPTKDDAEPLQAIICAVMPPC